MNSGIIPYDPIRRYISDYFNNPIVTYVGNTATGLKVYIANVVADNIISQRYILLTSDDKSTEKERHISEIDWNTFQTRTGKYKSGCSDFNYVRPEQSPLFENTLELVTVEEDKITFKSQKIRVNVVIQTENDHRSFNQLTNVARALETYSCLLIHL
jgi:hypothetical protein